MTPRNYPSPDRFKAALEARIRSAAAALSTSVARHRQRCVFDRFLARIAVHFGDRAVLKGGMLVPPETRTGDDFFGFAGLPPTTLRVYAREVHVAEKLHALTLPRPRENTRVKDLPDLALLATTGAFDGALLHEAIHATFTHRASHAVPTALPAPPPRWTRPYADMAQENDLPWPNLEDVFARTSAFLDPVLRGDTGTWDPAGWSWRSKA